MTFEAVRQAIVTAVDAAVPNGMVVTIDNDPFNWATPPEVFNHVRVEFVDASQIGMAAAPKTRDSGYVRLRTHIRAGQGSRPATEAMDWLRGALEFQILGAPGARVTFEALQPEGSDDLKGWCMHDSRLFFRVHPA